MSLVGISTLTAEQKTELLRYCTETKAAYELELTNLGLTLPDPYIRTFFIAGSYVNDNAHPNSDLDVVFLLPSFRTYKTPSSKDIKYLKIKYFFYYQRFYNLPAFLNVTTVPSERIYHPNWKTFEDNNNLLYDLQTEAFIKDLEVFWQIYEGVE